MGRSAAAFCESFVVGFVVCAKAQSRVQGHKDTTMLPPERRRPNQRPSQYSEADKLPESRILVPACPYTSTMPRMPFAKISCCVQLL